MRLVVATHNRGKMREIQALLQDLDVEVSCLADMAPEFTIVEDGATFIENAVKKAEAVAEYCRCPALADDSGLCVDALGGRPGVHSARFAGEGATDAQNNQRLLALLKDAQERSARFVCAMALDIPGRETLTVEGICEGRIAESPAGDGGFGYDPLFIPEGYAQTFAELGSEIKNAISHRAKALQKIRELIRGMEDTR